MSDFGKRLLIDTEDIFENDEFVIIKAYFVSNSRVETELSIGFKNFNGDIIDITVINRNWD